MIDDDDDDLGIELGDSESPDDSIGGESVGSDFVESRSVTITQGVNFDALQCATEIGIDDSIIRQAFISIEEMRQFYGAKDEAVARTCDEMDATIRMMLRMFNNSPDHVIASILRSRPVDEWKEFLKPIEEVLQWANSKINC